jgi:glycosyltransferase involved in cell wall biosynthesis
VRWKVSDDPDVDVITKGKLKVLDHIGRYVVENAGLQALFYPSSFMLLRHPWFREADIVQLYNIHGYFFSHLALPLIRRRKKLVWRFSDMWPLTGHCAYSYDCDRWKTGCGRCPSLGEYPPLRFDTSSLLWRIKGWTYRHSEIHLVATNSWMKCLMQESPFFSGVEPEKIPNGVNLEFFKPLPKKDARSLLGIAEDAKVVIFAAHVAVPGTRKGGEFVVPAMEGVARAVGGNIVLVVLGEMAESWKEGMGYRTVRLGYTQSERLLAIVYSAADVLLSPSVAENFPNTVLEAFACGTPAVAFDVGGMSDVVTPMETGYLARYRDPEDLAHGLGLLLTEDVLRMRMKSNCEKFIKEEYSLELQAKRFKELYERVLSVQRTDS